MKPIEKYLKNLRAELNKSKIPHLPMDQIHGFLSAVLSGPYAIPPGEWLHIIFLSENPKTMPPFKSKAQLESILNPLFKINNCIIEELLQQNYEPYMQVQKIDAEEVLVPTGWCKGFLLGIAFYGNDVFENIDQFISERLILITHFAYPEFTVEQFGMEVFTDLEKNHDEIISDMGDIVMDIYDYMHNENFPEVNEETPDLFSSPETADNYQQIGRNDLCPCGSGKKYKKCCGKETD